MMKFKQYRNRFKCLFQGKAGVLGAALLLLSSCAKMGSPDGGWYDETPPKVVGASPADKAINVKSKKVNIYFDEFIKLENASEKVVVSPPQLEAPIIKGEGKRISVELQDELIPNTTYTVDFSDAISDNNEGNPLGNYTYSFSTGDVIDTMEVSGTVLEAENLEPIKGILVGLYSNQADSAFTTESMLRVSRTDSRGRFVIKGVAPGSYRVYALQDQDGNYIYSQKSEKLAFNHDIIVPSSRPDVRQDTTWVDTLHIKNINQVEYTRFLPDNIILTAFTEKLTDRQFLKAERKEADHFSLFFTYGDDRLPEIKGLNFDEKDAFIIESSADKDTITYWLKDTALVNQDTLRMDLCYRATDSLGVLRNVVDSAFEVLSKDTYAKRIKRAEKELKEWKSKQEKRKKRGEKYDSIMAPKPMEFSVKVNSQMDPDQNVDFVFNKPLAKLDTAGIHLYAKHDTLWYRSPFEINKIADHTYQLKGEWRPEIEYSLEVDSAAFADIYGNVSAAYKQGFKVKSMDEYSTLLLNLASLNDTSVVVQLLDKSDKVVKEVATNNGVAEFFYIKPETYYLRLYVDSNHNGKWDTGEYKADRQAEAVYYYPEKIECRAKWDVTETWNPTAVSLDKQKPAEITKQKADKEKKVKHQNAQRARNLGIQYIP